MSKKKMTLVEIAEFTKYLFHDHYAGNWETWFSYLGPDSVYLGTGEPLLLGKDAITEHFKCFPRTKMDIIQEEYFPIWLGDYAAQVCGQIIVKSKSHPFCVTSHFTLGYRIIQEELKLIHQHISYEYMQHENGRALKLDADTIQFVRSLLLERPSDRRIPIRSGYQTVFVDPYTILYVQSRRKRTELVCIDRIISCNSPLWKLAKDLPNVFYPLHRGYLVNTLYIVSIRRFEAELISKITLPIPARTYMQVKEDLGDIIRNGQRSWEK